MIQRMIRKSAIAATLLAPGLMLAQTVPQVCDFNVFVFGNHTSSYSTVEGRVAAGGNASYKNYGFAHVLPSNASQFNLIAGGTVNFEGGHLEKGSLVANGAIALKNVTVDEGSVIGGSSIASVTSQVHGQTLPNQFKPVPVDFAGAKTNLLAASAFYATLQPTAPTIRREEETVMLQGTNPDLNVFTLSNSNFEDSWRLRIAVPAGSTVLINVKGKAGRLPAGGYSYTGVDPSRVLFNFYEATNLNLGGSQGFVLAPLADIVFPNGVTRGTIVGKSLKGNGHATDVKFAGKLPVLPNGQPFCGEPELSTQ